MLMTLPAVRRSLRSIRLVGLGALLACAQATSFSTTVEAQTQIEGGTLLEQLAGDMGFDSFLAFDVTANEQFANQGVERHQIDSVRLTALRLNASAGDFTFLDRLEFFVEAEGQDRVRIAHGGPFPEGQADIELSLDDVDLAPYAAAETMDLKTVVQGRRPDQDTTITAGVDFLIDVNVSGALCGAVEDAQNDD
jgi:hypothetical protein